ncbi:MAG: class I SAM-dependent methyltransferase [Actinobacteria bacterium]|nr:class I SAM-dependent methyltransferase [Actinomycetota bacterium]
MQKKWVIMENFRTDKFNFILNQCRGKRVLDIGCINHTLEATTKSNWFHRQLKKVAAKLVGLDYEKSIVKKLQKDGWEIIAADAQNFDIRKKYPKGFDVIVASDIIEHLVDPGSFLTCVRKHLAPKGVLILTTPHAYGLAFFIEVLILGEEVINDDHTMTFSRKNMYWLMEKCGLKVKEFYWLIQDSSLIHSSIGKKILAKPFFWIQRLAATFRAGFSKEMIVVAIPGPAVKLQFSSKKS